MNVDTGNWDQGELEEMFFWLQRVLQRYADNPGCGECLRLARDGLAQIRSGLGAAGRDDAVQLCEEMHRVVQDLEAERIGWTADGAELLVRAALQMSGPLGLAGAAPERLARVLLPLVNDLRALRGAGRLMTPAIVMAPEPTQPEVAVIPAADDGHDRWFDSLQDARGRFQRGLHDLLQGRDQAAAARRLADAATAVAGVLQGSAAQLLFRAAARLAGALARDAAVAAQPVQQLLERVDCHLGEGLRRAQQIRTDGADPATGAFPVDAELLAMLDAATDEVQRGVAATRGLSGSGAVRALVPGQPALRQPERTSRAAAPGGEGGWPAATRTRKEAAPAASLDCDRERLQAPALAVGVAAASEALVDAVETEMRQLRTSLNRWLENPRNAVLAAAMGELFHNLRERARAGGAQRLGEFAGVLESFIAVLGPAGAADVEAVQVVEDAVNVLPGLLDELRTGAAPETPLADIVLRIEAILAEGPGTRGEEDAGPEPAAQDEAALDRLRRQAGAEMARLAAAFAALDDAPASGIPAAAAPGPGTAAESGAASAAMFAGARARAAEIAAWHQRVVDALTQAALQTQALEQGLDRVRAGLGPGAAGGPPPTPSGASAAGVEHALDELEKLRLNLGAAIGNASAALLQQRRATQALQDRLAADPGGAGSADA
jgi:hypothetical protein